MENFPDENTSLSKVNETINEIQNINGNNNLIINKEIKTIKKREKIDKEEIMKEVKKYLNYNAKDNEYSGKIKNNPDSLFETLKEDIIMKWEVKLFNNFSYNKTTTDEMILSEPKDKTFQIVIKNDCVRTRVRESIIFKNFKEILESMITYYCRVKNVYYKQGLNEIFGPLILMKHKIKQLKLSKIFLLGDLFIDRFLPNYFYEKDFYSLKSSLALYVILLKYHEPSVYNRLDKIEILPEMYATNWLMTLMSGKVKLNILFLLWDYIINHDDPLFMHFVLVAFLIYKRELIINCDKSLLPPLISNLTIFTEDELKYIMNLADELVKKTPYSFRILANKLKFLIPNTQNIQNLYEQYKPQSIPAMPIFPQEIFYIVYDNKIQCPDPDCDNEKGFQKIMKNGKIKYKLGFDLIDNPDVNDYGEKMKEHKCEKCKMNIIKNLDFILIDLRILENDLNRNENNLDKTGYLPKMIQLNQEELKSEDLNDILTNKYIEERGKYHFIFLTSTTDTFSKFESNFYKDNISEQDKQKMIYGLIKQKKADKELDLKSVNLSPKEIYILKEYDNLRKTIISMQKQNYPYISFAYGGFSTIHKESFKLGIELPLHNAEKCSLCHKQKEKNKNKNQNEEEKEKNNLYKELWEHKKKIQYKNLSQYFNDPKINICFGSLIEYKGKNLSLEKIQILIATLFSQFKIEIYKFDIKKQYNLDKPSYYDLGLNDDEEKDRELIILEELKVSDIVGMNIDKKTKNILHFNIKVRNSKKNEDNKKKNENLKFDSYNMIVDLSSSNDAKNFFKIFRNMSEEYKKYYKIKLENK